MTVVPSFWTTGVAPAVPAVAFCPSAPLLLPAAEGRCSPETDALRRACADAVAAMLDSAPATVIVVGAGPVPRERLIAGDAGDLRDFGVPLEVPFDGPGRPEGRRLPLAHLVGAWLLDAAGSTAARVGIGPVDLVELMSEVAGPVGILAIGDGSARRTVKAPGYLDPAAEPFDAAVAGALAAGDAATLAALDAVEGARLLAAGVPTWRAVGAAFAGRAVSALLLHDTAPFGVGYPVAYWTAA